MKLTPQDKAFLQDLKEVLERHGKAPEDLHAEPAPKAKPPAAAKAATQRRCKKWGKIPGTNQRVCLEWESVD